MEIEISKITERGQVTIPQEFREELNLKGGEKIVFMKENGSLLLKPMKNIKAYKIEDLREEMMDKKIIDKFDRDVKSGKIRLITQTKEDFLKDLESW